MSNSSRLQNFTIFYNNSEEYHHLKREIFTSNLYYFETSNPKPLIIDAGAHIGLSTLYFKKVYPGAQIIAIEPNPKSFEILEKNIFENQIYGVTTINAALSTANSQEKLFLDSSDDEWHSTASFHKGTWAGTQKSSKIIVKTQTLAEFITQPIDFLKLDIEGSEQKVLTQAASNLKLVSEMHVEFHTHATQSLGKLVELLEKTHEVELFKGTQIVQLKKATGLVQIRARNKNL